MNGNKRQYNIHEAKTYLPAILDEVAAGQSVVIARNGHPIARIEVIGGKTLRRVPDLLKGKGHVPDDFFAPLSDVDLASRDWFRMALPS